MIPLSDRHIDLDRRQVRLADRAVRLTRREVELLAYLAARPGEVVSLDELHARVWGHHPNVVSRAAYHTWRRLLPKLERDPSMPVHLHLVHGEGVLLRPATPAAPRAPLLGRDAELAELGALCGAHPYVTVAGPGGIGKSTLARAWLGAGAWCDARGATTREGLVAAIAAGLGLAREAPEEAVRVRCVGPVVIDNVEQVADLARGLLEDWSDAGVSGVVCTSRAALGGAREGVLRLGGLALPDAARVLADRCGGDADDDALRALAEAVEGVPLALELAAARTRVLSVTEVLEVLQTRRLALLSDPTRHDRHASLHAVLLDAWDALEPGHQRVLSRLAPWVGGFTRAHLDPLVDDLGLWGVDVLHVLVDASWVHGEAGARFRLLEVTREFVRAVGPDPDDADARLVAAFDRPPPARPVPLAWMAEGRNLEAAVRTALDRGWPERAARVWLGFAEAASETRLRSVVALGEALRSGPALPPGLHLHVGLAHGDALFAVNRNAEVLELAAQLSAEPGSREEASLRLLRGVARHMAGDAAGGLDDVVWAHDRAAVLGMQHLWAASGLRRASVLRVLGRAVEARAMYETLLRELDPHEHPSLVPSVSAGLAVLVRREGDEARAIALLRDALDHDPREGNLAILGCNLAQLFVDAERPDEADEVLDELSARVERLGLAVFAARVRAMRGQVALQRGRLDEARRHLAAALPGYVRGGNTRPRAWALATLALIEARMGNADAAAAHTAEAWSEVEGFGPEGRARLAYRLGRAARAGGGDAARWVARGDAFEPPVVAPFLARERDAANGAD